MPWNVYQYWWSRLVACLDEWVSAPVFPQLMLPSCMLVCWCCLTQPSVQPTTMFVFWKCARFFDFNPKLGGWPLTQVTTPTTTNNYWCCVVILCFFYLALAVPLVGVSAALFVGDGNCLMFFVGVTKYRIFGIELSLLLPLGHASFVLNYNLMHKLQGLCHVLLCSGLVLLLYNVSLRY